MSDNEAMMALLSVLEADTAGVNKVYSFSSHAAFAQGIINTVLKDHPEWENTLAMLSIYPVQLWAAEARKKAGIDIKSIIAMMDDEEGWFGIQSKTSALNQKRALDITDKGIALIGKAIDNDSCKIGTNISLIRAVHGIGYEDVSIYIMKKYYEETLIKLCEALSPKINRLLKPIEKDLAEIDQDIKLIYHDADLLIQVCGNMYGKRRRHRRYAQIDYEIVYKQMIECIAQLKDYPFGGKDMYLAIHESFNGATEVAISEKMRRSRTYMRKKYEEGVTALGCLIWGYTTPQILGSGL